MDYARLTGQSVQTIDLFRPIRNFWGRVRDWARASTTAAGLTWMSRYIYNYPQLMLMDLGQNRPATLQWPLFGYPPPHFLVGYQYLVRICNDYIFDSRAYSRLKYHEIHAPMQQMLNWSLLANCSYSINTGAYHRFVDLDNFNETLGQVQQAILAERVVADLQLIQPMAGYGTTHLEGLGNVPVQHYLQEQRRNIGDCQQEAWGMAERIRIQSAGKNDLIILQTIRKLKNAYFNYLISDQSNTRLSLPCDCCWLDAFVETFGDPVEITTLMNRGLSIQKITKCMISALSLPGDSPVQLGLAGGAFELRPRENGRAVTQEMRIRRGEVIQRFIDSLPLPRRRRRRVPGPEEPPISPSPGPSDMEEPEDMGEEELPASFEEEVRVAIADVIRLLQEELTVSARSEEFFNFAVDFYQVMSRLEDMGEITELAIRRWVMYFFVAEHIATTLNYLQHALRHYAPFSRLVDLNLGQVVMRARDGNGEVVYSRVWNEYGVDSLPRIMQRISTDLAATVERAGMGDLTEEEVENFMADIAYHDNSGDVEEILRQVAMNDTLIESVELSFRFKVTGPVILSQQAQIQTINRRVVSFATQLRSQYQPLPVHNQAVVLPPYVAPPP